MSSYILPLLPLPLTLLSSYTLTHSFQSIQNMRSYEDTAKRAAEWSNIAEENLWKTRTTEGVSGVVTLLSLVSSLALTLSPLFSTSSSSSSSSNPSRTTFIILATVNAAACFAAQAHIAGFWKNKAKVPFVKRYNNAISQTNVVRVLLGWLGVGWIGVGVVGGLVAS